MNARLFLTFATCFLLLFPASAATPEEKPEGEIEGITIARPDGRWLGLTMEGPRLFLTFYDKEKHPEIPDVASVTVRLLFASRNPERGVMSPTPDGQRLTFIRPIRPPWNFKIFLTLINPQGQALESHNVDYN